MSAVAGIAALLTGWAYILLGGIAAWELWRDRASRGWSHFGAGIVVLALTCGPHHLVCATHYLFEAEAAPAPQVLALLLGMPAGLVVVGLRVEALLGGRGERFVAGTPLWLMLLPWLWSASAGAILLAAVSRGSAAPAHLALSVALFLSFVVVGFLIIQTQVARRPARGGWSLSGLGLAGVFATCSITHLTTALTMAPDWHMYLVDGAGVPASLYFLAIVHALNRRSLRDWNRRPIIGATAATRRESPWQRSASGPEPA